MSIFLMMLCVVSTSCFSGNSFKLSSDVFRLKTEIIKKIPIGSDIKTAESVMTCNGFKCKKMMQTDFVEINQQMKKGKTHEKLNYIYCDQEKIKWPNFLISERWQVAIVFSEDKVKDVLISYGLTGL